MKQLAGKYLFVVGLCVMNLFFGSEIYAQQKMKYTAAMDSVWSKNLHINMMTENGDWVVFTEFFNQKNNDIYLRNTKDSTVFKFVGAQWLTLSNDNHFFGCILPDKQLQIVSLENRTNQTYNDVESFSFSESGEYLSVLSKKNKLENTLLVQNNYKNNATYIMGVEKYVWHPDENKLLLKVKDNLSYKLMIYDAESSEYNVVKDNVDGGFKNVFWNTSGNVAIAIERKGNENQIICYRNNGELLTLNNKTVNVIFPNTKISSKKVNVSGCGKKVFFYRENNTVSSEINSNSMEIWETNQKLIYPEMLDYKNNDLNYMLTIWNLDSDELMAVETEKRPISILNFDHNIAIVYDKLKYEPLYKEYPYADLYVKNLNSGEEQLIVYNQYTDPRYFKISPNGNFVAYYKENHWFLYDVLNQKTINLTIDEKVLFESYDNNFSDDSVPAGCYGWTENDEFIILYDHYDIWLMSMGAYKERITRGRESTTTFRFSNLNKSKSKLNGNSKGYLSNVISIKGSVIVEIYDNTLHKSGYALLGNTREISTIIFEDRKLDEVFVTKDFKDILLRKQKYNEPPSIYKISMSKNEQKLIYQSNNDLLKYDLGKAELIKYRIGEEILSGALLYPSNFDSEKKYPMIVYIYEKPSYKINIFDSPSNYGYDGFSSIKLTTDGYFVLYPDISYVLGEPGISALNCVTGALDEVLKLEYIDDDKIGLIGHSFGGYQSAFIATQTNRFAAVVAGAPVTNITSHYHSVGLNWNRPEFWRYESQQWRMGDSYYNIKSSYLKNSPIEWVENTSTPLLLWSGKRDYQVDWTQSVQMFLALKRLNKTSKLLLFNDESHIIIKEKNQRDLFYQIKDWFDTFCK